MSGGIKDTKSVLLFEVGFDIIVELAGIFFRPAHDIFIAHAKQRGADIIAEIEFLSAFFEKFKAVADVNVDHAHAEVRIFLVNIFNGFVTIGTFVVIEKIDFAIVKHGGFSFFAAGTDKQNSGKQA